MKVNHLQKVLLDYVINILKQLVKKLILMV